MWRYRDRAAIAGLALGYGVAVKLFLWPLVVVARADRPALARPRSPRPSRRRRCCSLLPFTEPRRLRTAPAKPRRDVRARGIHPVRAAHRYRRPGHRCARDHGRASALGVLALAWRRRSLGLAIAAALILSPIVWRHFFTLLLVPLALSRPRFDAVWLDSHRRCGSATGRSTARRGRRRSSWLSPPRRSSSASAHRAGARRRRSASPPRCRSRSR